MFQLRARITNLFLASTDALVTLGSFLVAYFLAGNPVGMKGDVSPQLLYVLVPLWSCIFVYFGLYHSRRTDSYFSDTWILFKGICLGTGLLSAIKLLYEPLPLSGQFLFVFLSLNFLCLAVFRFCMRLLLRSLRRRGMNTKKLIVVGAGQIVDRIIEKHAYPTDRMDYVLLKRAFDLIVASCILLFLFPLLLLIAFGVKLTSRGPAIFKQERVGLNGRKFWMYKFRTMRLSSPEMSNTRWTLPDDERITAVGKLLRRSSLDELPQLLNVLKGDMSMVGPRPERPHFVETFSKEVPHYMQRHYLKCGITGWAQVNGWRGDTSIRRRIEFDLYYLQHWAFWFDIKILLITCLRGLYQRNAY
jgi:lipopolysaccharide/colanic/teichoic acid biosynthesis glycosyltransferase